MRFVLKHQQPLLIFTIYIHRDFNGAGIDFITDFHVFQFTILTQIFTGNGCHIHQGHDFLITMYLFT